MFRAQQSDQPDDGRDNLFSPVPGPGATSSHWNQLTQPTSLYTRLLELHPNRQRLLAVVAIAAATLWLRSRSQGRELRRHELPGTVDAIPPAPPPYPTPMRAGDIPGAYGDYGGEYIPVT
jgi:hypothetical protein